MEANLTATPCRITPRFAISPDVRRIAFEYAASRDAKTADIWIIGTDGKNLRLLVKDGWNPAWNR